MLCRLLLICVIASPCFAGAAQAEPSVKRNTRYYTVEGQSPSQIRASINSSRHMDYDAFTQWNVSWHYTYASERNRCSISTVSTDVTITMDLPQLVEDQGRPADVTDGFARYMTSLRRHEEGHAQISLDAARKIETALATLEPQPTCNDMGVRANAVGDEIIETFKAVERDYDVRTDHGGTQGARYP